MDHPARDTDTQQASVPRTLPVGLSPPEEYKSKCHGCRFLEIRSVWALLLVQRDEKVKSCNRYCNINSNFIIYLSVIIGDHGAPHLPICPYLSVITPHPGIQLLALPAIPASRSSTESFFFLCLFFILFFPPKLGFPDHLSPCHILLVRAKRPQQTNASLPK